MSAVDLLGWCATAVFVGSYFFSKPVTLRRVQVLGALLWVVYGALLPAAPVIAANLLVVTAAAWTAQRGGWAEGPGGRRGRDRHGPSILSRTVTHDDGETRHEPGAIRQDP